MTMKERIDAARFVRELETVSVELASWAQQKVDDEWTVEDIKLHLQNVAKFINR